jgi:hypothetical protein
MCQILTECYKSDVFDLDGSDRRYSIYIYIG